MSLGSYTSCNNGAIVARSLTADGNHYISQLNVTVTPDILGSTIECGYDNGYSYHFHSLVLSTIDLNFIHVGI